MSSIVESLDKNYYASGPSRFFDSSRFWGDTIDYALCVIASVGHAISTVFRLQGKEAPKGATECENQANTGRMMVSTLRTFQSLENLFTLKWLYARDNRGKVLKSDGRLQFGHPLSIAASLSLIAGRILGFVNTIHRLCIADLGKHAQRISQSITGIYTALCMFSLVNSISNFISAKADQVQDATVGLVQDIAATTMHPFECGLGMSSTSAPWLGIVGSVVSALGAIVIIATLMNQVRSFRVDPDA